MGECKLRACLLGRITGMKGAPEQPLCVGARLFPVQKAGRRCSKARWLCELARSLTAGSLGQSECTSCLAGSVARDGLSARGTAAKIRVSQCLVLHRAHWGIKMMGRGTALGAPEVRTDPEHAGWPGYGQCKWGAYELKSAAVRVSRWGRVSGSPRLSGPPGNGSEPASGHI